MQFSARSWICAASVAAGGVLIALPAYASAATSTTVQGHVVSVDQARSQFTLVKSGTEMTVTVPRGDLLVHGLPAQASALVPGMVVLAQGRVTSAHALTASAVHAITPLAATSSMHGTIASTDLAGRIVVVRINGGYDTAVAYLGKGLTINGTRNASALRSLRTGAVVTLTGHRDNHDPSELLASRVSVR